MELQSFLGCSFPRGENRLEKFPIIEKELEK
jgi:hypothetical protein